MKIVLVTGSAGLIGSESVSFFIERGFTVIGLDNNMRQTFFGQRNIPNMTSRIFIIHILGGEVDATIQFLNFV